MADTDPAGTLKAACDEALAAPDLQPQYDASGKLLSTHCNQALRQIAQAMGVHDFDDPAATADLMFAIMATSAKWRKVDGATATIAALSGSLAVAAMPSTRLQQAHGHVAVVYPQGMQRSESLAHDVPLVANVGKGDPIHKKNWICKSSEAFPVNKGEADYYVRSL